MGYLKTFSRGIKYAALITLTYASISVASSSNLHYGIEDNRKPKKHASMVVKAASDILYRLSSPFPTDPQADFKRLQTKFIDESVSVERRFLKMVKGETNSSIKYLIFAYSSEDEIIKKGFVFDLDAKNKYKLFERHGTEKSMGMLANESYRYPTEVDRKELSSVVGGQACALRRSPTMGVISGYFLNNAWPTTTREFLIDSHNLEHKKRVESNVDVSYGWFKDGRAVFSQIEYSLPTLVNELYLHVRAKDDVVIWTGDFGKLVEVKKVGSIKKSVLEKAEKVSVLASLDESNIGYNPYHLNAKEARKILRNIPGHIDMLVADGSRNETNLRKVRYNDKLVGIINADYWQNTHIRPNIKKVPLTKDLEKLIEEGSMVTLPKGTQIVRNGDSIGIPIEKPDYLPVAKYISADVTWISSNEKELMNLVSNQYVIPLMDEFALNIMISNRVIHKIILKKEYRKPDPYIMLGEGEDIIQIQFGVNWENPWIEAMKKLNLPGVYAMTYDPKTGKFKYHYEGNVPFTQKVTVERPRYTKKPKLIEK